MHENLLFIFQSYFPIILLLLTFDILIVNEYMFNITYATFHLRYQSKSNITCLQFVASQIL